MEAGPESRAAAGPPTEGCRAVPRPREGAAAAASLLPRVSLVWGPVASREAGSCRHRGRDDPDFNQKRGKTEIKRRQLAEAAEKRQMEWQVG
ncbi:small VCP/p97-interacting protein isoform X1 [Opisthocomus hoazin]|uniref:small VCP/p97-interacting protein isoform X1 n=1 Tax=Opisthocomus hoazin TaxID=30419 RepID=UPI003F53A751